MKKLILAALFGTVAVTPTFADHDLSLEKHCTVKRSQAQSIALVAFPGTITDTDVEKTADGKYYWSIDIRPASGPEKEVHVCGHTGTVLGVELDDD